MVERILLPLQSKLYDLKVNSITQRILLIDLFNHYCDASYYDSFKQCSEEFIPTLTSDFETILKKLNDLVWNTVSGSEDTVFNYQTDIWVEDRTLANGKNATEIQFLKKHG